MCNLSFKNGYVPDIFAHLRECQWDMGENVHSFLKAVHA